MDERDLCQTAFDRGSLSKFSNVVHALTLPPATENKRPPKSEERQRKTCCYPYHDHDRRSPIQRYSTRCCVLPAVFIPLVSAITHQHTSAPHAPCHCVRALLRTSLANLGLRTAMIAIFTKEDEDRRLLHASPATVCNLVNQEPPRYSLYKRRFWNSASRRVSHAFSDHLASMIGRSVPQRAVGVKNLVYICPQETNQAIMVDVGGPRLMRARTIWTRGCASRLLPVAELMDWEDDVGAALEALGTPLLPNAL